MNSQPEERSITFDDPRRVRLREICQELPEVTIRDGQHITFQVRNRTFAYYLDNHHGDGRVAVTCKTWPGENTALVDRDPVRYFIPAYLGPRGWVGLRLDLPDMDWDEVDDLVHESYQLIAPKRLASQVQQSST